MRFNPSRPKLSQSEWQATPTSVEQRLCASALGPRRSAETSPNPNQSRLTSDALFAGLHLLVLSGSLPRDVPVTVYAQLIRLARRFGVRTLLDCDGSALAAAVKARPSLVKPNEHELAQWAGNRFGSEADVVRAASALSSRTGEWVLVSRGAKRALLVNSNEKFVAFEKPPLSKPRNTVGAGDAMLAAVANHASSGAQGDSCLR